MIDVMQTPGSSQGWPVFALEDGSPNKVRQGWLREEEKELYWVSLDRPDAEPQGFPKAWVDLGPRYFVHVTVPLNKSVSVEGILSDNTGHVVYKDFGPFTDEELNKILGLFRDALKGRAQAFPPQVAQKQLRWVQIVGPIGVSVTSKWTQERLNAVFQHQGFQG